MQNAIQRFLIIFELNNGNNHIQKKTLTKYIHFNIRMDYLWLHCIHALNICKILFHIHFPMTGIICISIKCIRKLSIMFKDTCFLYLAYLFAVLPFPLPKVHSLHIPHFNNLTAFCFQNKETGKIVLPN